MTLVKRRIAVVVPILARHDAISAAARDAYLALRELSKAYTTIFALRNDFDDIPVRIVTGVSDLLLEPDFCAADLLIFHFGIYSPLFDALLIGNRHARRIVRFHNITPLELVPRSHAQLIERSLRQIHNIEVADEIWADSEVNAQELRTRGIPAECIHVIPLAVGTPSSCSLAEKGSSPLEMLFVGRIVPSKGVLDLVQAYATLCKHSSVKVRLRLAGNLEWSDPTYLRRVRAAVDDLRTLDATLVGTVDSETLAKLYRAAHILAVPSYHEGFCKPVVEGLRAGCVPIGYDAYNLPHIVAGLGRMVPTGDIGALEAALVETTSSVAAGLRGETDARLQLDCGKVTIAEFDALARNHVQRFLPDRIAAELRGHATKHLDQRMRSPMRVVHPKIVVLPDDRARERERTSLNRLPDLPDWEAGGVLSDLMRDIRQSVTIHRKSWEYATCIHGLTTLGAVHADSACLAVGAGTETPLYYFANTVRTVVATDLYDNAAHEGTPLMFEDPRRFAPFPYREDRLKVLRMRGEELGFPNESFDFLFCLSSIEHFGSRDVQAQSLDEMARVLRPGGIACITTELILTEHSDREYFRWEELERMFLRHPRFILVGGEPDLTISESLVTFPLDIECSKHINRSPHIVIRRGDMLWTSFSMFLRRVSS